MNFVNRLIWAAVGGFAGGRIGNQFGETEEERKVNRAKGRLIGSISAFAGTYVFEEPENTVNYILKNNGKRVYDGVSKDYRVKTRISEHKSQGKIFNEVVIDSPKTASKALKLEKSRIKRFNGEYNIQHKKF